MQPLDGIKVLDFSTLLPGPMCTLLLAEAGADVIKIAAGQSLAPNLVAMMEDPSRQKIFHYGRFDIAVLFQTFGVTTVNVATRLLCQYTSTRAAWSAPN